MSSVFKSDSSEWEEKLEEAIRLMLAHPPYWDGIPSAKHVEKTPQRVVAAFKEYFSGCLVDVEKLLTSALFPVDGHTQMIHVKEITFHSVCAHHLALISGTAHFAYIPDNNIIGLSKIPRLVDAFARRPQVQEKMSDQIVDSFMQYVKPIGCGISITANHACMQCRGIRSQRAITDTTSLRGSFLRNDSTKNEFLMWVKG